MTPSLSTHNVVYIRFGYAKTTPDLVVTKSVHMHLPYFFDIIITKFGEVLIRASVSYGRSVSLPPPSTTRHHICGIFLKGSSQEVARIYAGWIIAFVSNRRAFRQDNIMMKLEGRSMGLNSAETSRSIIFAIPE